MRDLLQHAGDVEDGDPLQIVLVEAADAPLQSAREAALAHIPVDDAHPLAMERLVRVEVGEDVPEEVKLVDLGRRTVLTLRQNLVARVHEHDNSIIYKHFIDLVGEIYTAEVHHIRNRVVILLDDDDCGNITGDCV